MELLLIGGLEVFSFFHILRIIIPTDFIFFRGVGRLNHQADTVIVAKYLK